MEAASLDEALDEAHNEAMHARVGAWVVQAAEATGVDALAESAATSDNVEEGKGQDGAADSHDKDQEHDAEEEERGAEEERGVEAEAEVEAEAMEDKGVVEESEEQGVDDEAVQAEQDVEASGQDADDGITGDLSPNDGDVEPDHAERESPTKKSQGQGEGAKSKRKGKRTPKKR
mmetsp:Transcript_46652/g.101309  ORF Transcript_46652/g.101309 Transcript_46652/m.101309 type:complete len:175 (-) Transcript_46652:49-573(-)